MGALDTGSGPSILLRLLQLALLTQRLLPRTLHGGLRTTFAHQRQPRSRARRTASSGKTVTFTACASSLSTTRSRLTFVLAGLNQIIVPCIALLSAPLAAEADAPA